MKTIVKKNNTNIRSAFTQIELIFVILIIAVLASIALGKLSITRDDAKLSASVANMAICITDVSAYYTATQLDYNATNHPFSCNTENTECYNIVYAIKGKDFNVDTNATGYGYCADIENVGGHLAKSYDFGGSTVQR